MLKITFLLLGMSVGIATLGESSSSDARSVETGPPPAVASVQQGNNSILGHIFDTSHRPLAGVHVELQGDFSATVIGPVRTDGSGVYAFTGLPSGVYQVVVKTYGTDYVGQTQRVEIDSLSRIRGSSASLQVDFTLKTKREDTASVSARPGVIFSQEVPDNARRIYDDAIKDLDSAREDESGIEGLKKAISIFPNYFLALERLGTEYVKRQQYEPARAVLTKAVEVNPRADQSLYWLGIAQYQLKDTSAAIGSLGRAVSLSPNSVNLQMWLGKALWRDGRFDEAETHFKQAYKLGGKRVPVVHLYLAQLYDREKRYREEADELELYLKEEPNSANTETIRNSIARLRMKPSK